MTATSTDRARRLQTNLELSTLRRRLALSFVCVSSIIFFLTGLIALLLFSANNDTLMESNLQRIIHDISPAVQLKPDGLTLKNWANNAAVRNLNVLHVVQLYDHEGHLKERYGAPGVIRLYNGNLQLIGLHKIHNFRSRYIPILNAGFLQIQVDTKQTDDSLQSFVTTFMILVPVVAIISGLCGFWFAGKAVQPVARSLTVLKDFVDDAGHELKTPVSIISASIEFLEEILANDQTGMDVLSKIRRASTRLQGLSANLLLLARMESLDLKTSTVAIDDLVEQAHLDFLGKAQQKDITLCCHAESSAVVSGQAESLYTMLLNMLDNALRYSPAGGSVRMSTDKVLQKVEIAISDDGPGIPPESLGRVFDRFYRVDSARSSNEGGTGLGLSIVKAIAEAHGGSVRVESKLSRGSTFTVTLPIAGATQPRKGDRQADLSMN